MQRLFLAVSAVLAVAITIWVIGQRPKNLAAEPPPSSSEETAETEAKPKDTESVLDKAVTAAKPSPAPSEASPSEPTQTPVEDMSEAEFLRLYNDTDFARSMPTALLVEKLEEQDPADVAQYLQNLLDNTGSRDLNERGRTLFLANELRSPDLIPFWGHVLNRSPKALENEAALFQAREPNVESMALRNELSTAIRNLNLMAFKDGSALDLLTSYVKKPDPNFDNTIFRKEAYYAVKEVNVTAAARLVQGLPKDDPLRVSLSRD